MSTPLSPAPRWERRLILLLILAGVLLTALFGLRALQSYQRIRHIGPPPHAAGVEDIRPWMTIPYIARVCQIPAEELFAAIGAPPEGNENKTIRELEDHYANGNRGQLIEALKRVITEHHRNAPPPPEASGG